ncbi:MAG: alpha/beta hydrolase [Haloarculaceae archaeon]
MRRVALPGAREVRGTRDGPDDADPCVVACPPHPEMGGTRADPRLRAVGEALAERGVACLRFDYGDWDEGVGERADAHTALDWAGERHDRVALLGYSFGGAVALATAAERDDLRAVATLAPAAGLPDGTDSVASLDATNAPVLVVYGERDRTVDWEPVVERARAAGHTVRGVPSGHGFAGQRGRVADSAASFLADPV